ncbi:MAG: ribose-phosphate diphosphokinase [Candidatus Hermodarchaeota archaeon]
MIVIEGPASTQLARDVAERLQCELCAIDKVVFSNGETKLTFKSNVKDKSCIVVQSCYPRDIDQHLIQLFFLIAKCQEMQAKEIVVVIPYFGYQRQDKEFLKGEVVSAKVIVQIIEALGADKVILVNIHSDKILDFFTIPAYDILPFELMGAYFAENFDLMNPIALAPDKKAFSFAQEFAKGIKGKAMYINKSRDHVTQKVTFEFPEKTDFSGSDVFVVDDVVGSGSTTPPIVKFAKDNGANRVFVAVTAGEFYGDSLERTKAAGAEEIITTNAVNNSNIKTLTLAPLIAEKIKDIIV